MKSFKLLAAGSLIAALSLHAANATPTITYKLLLDGVQVTAGSTTSGAVNTGITGVPSFNNLFSVASLSILGVPLIPSPDLNTTTLTLTAAATFTGPHVLQLFVSQTNLVSPIGVFALGNTLNLNNQIGSISSSVSNYINANNAVYGQTTLMASLTGVPGGNAINGNGGTVTNVNVGGGPYSETEVLTATFTAAGQDLNTNDQIAYVPEPASLVLVGAGLFGLGLIRRRRNQGTLHNS